MPTLTVHYDGWLKLPEQAHKALGVKTHDLLKLTLAEGVITLRKAGTRCVVPGCDGACSVLTRQEEDALWRQAFMAQPARRREFEPSSKRRKRRPAPWPPVTG
jgi:hypothetical protein